MKDILLKYHNLIGDENILEVQISNIVSYELLWHILEYTINISFTIADRPGITFTAFIGKSGTGVKYDGILYTTMEDLDRLMVILERDRLADTLSIMPGGNDGL